MSEIIGYGEDSLTLWYLKDNLQDLSRTFHLETFEPSECLVFYRPSFGRGPSASTFGEFDAILVNRVHVYLIESKWEYSAELKQTKQSNVLRIEITERQQLRHRIFEWYLKNWQKEGDWSSFREVHLTEFMNTFDSMAIPKAETKLARNLEFILNRIDDHLGKSQGVIPTNLVIFFKKRGSAIHDPTVDNSNSNPPFREVHVEYTTIEKGDFFLLDGRERNRSE